MINILRITLKPTQQRQISDNSRLFSASAHSLLKVAHQCPSSPKQTDRVRVLLLNWRPRRQTDQEDSLQQTKVNTCILMVRRTADSVCIPSSQFIPLVSSYPAFLAASVRICPGLKLTICMSSALMWRATCWRKNAAEFLVKP